jgi:DNA modification methylase
MLALELEELGMEGFDVGLTGFDEVEIGALLADKTEEGFTDEEEIPEAPIEPTTKMGDVWLLGKHRVMCGDSTDSDMVVKLMSGKLASFVFTDPPWNVAYGTNLANNVQGYKQRTILNDSFDDPQKWADFLTATISCLSIATEPGCPIYCVMGPSEWPAVDKALREGGFHWSSTIIWVKDSLVLSRKDYHTKYEPIWYGWKDGCARICEVVDRKQSDVWEYDRPKVSPLHPTTKPIELVERAINNSSNAGAFVFEPFGGSGSTLIACEKTGRINRSMELDPKYCDVIIKRWQDFTGKNATLESNGKTFDELKTK